MTAVMIPASFYTCIVLRIGFFGSEIIDERHFKTLAEAEGYAEDMRKCGEVAIVATV